MKRIIATIIILLLAACVHLGPAPDERFFDALDTNSDGTVTLVELESRNLIIKSDEDGRKMVHQADDADVTGSTTPMTFEQKRKLFEEFDQNRDGSISRQEWNRASPEGYILWKF